MAIADLAYQRALDRLSAVGFDALEEWERDIATLWHVEARVNNGGLAGYYAGHGGDLAFNAPAALARAGAKKKSAILRAANALFGRAGPPRDRKKRRAALKALDARDRAAFDKLEKRYYADPVDVDDLVERLAGGGRR